MTLFSELKKLSSWVSDEDVRHEIQDKILQSDQGKHFLKEAEEQFFIQHPDFRYNVDCISMFNLLDELSKRIDALHLILDPKGIDYEDPEILAELRALKTLRREILFNPQVIIDKIEKEKDVKLFRKMGALFYMSSLVQVEANIRSCSSSSTPEMQQAIKALTNSEKVAIYGYTTRDYKGINKALRQNTGIFDQQAMDAFNEALKEKYPVPKDLDTIELYITVALRGMQKLPDIPSKKGGEPLRLQRIIATHPSPEWESKTFVIGQPYIDYGFSSITTKDVPCSGAIRLEYFLANPSDLTWKNAKDIGLFSAHPREGEIVFLPETEFICIDGRQGFHKLQLKI